MKRRDPYQLIKLTDPESEIRLAEGGGDALPTHFQGTAYSGGVIPKWNLVIDLKSARVESHMPLLWAHDHDKTIGNIPDVKNDGGRLDVGGDLYSDIDPEAAMIAKKSMRGTRFQLSVGAFGGTEEELPKGRNANINGRRVSGPLSILRGTHIRETSFCALGADSNTQVSLFSARRGGTAMPDENPQDGRDAALEAENAALRAQLAASTEALEAANRSLAETRDRARKEAVKRLWTELGREYDDGKATPYLALSDGDWAAVEADLRAMRPQVPGHLFAEQARGGKAQGTAPAVDSAAIYKARREHAHEIRS